MDTSEEDLTGHFRDMSDEELMSRCTSHHLTEVAQAIALRELDSRGLTLPEPSEPESDTAADYEGDYETVAQFLNPIVAQIVCASLETAGIPAYIADANLVQTNSLWSIALGGARVRVPARRVSEAKDIIAAFDRGDFTLPPDHESR